MNVSANQIAQRKSEWSFVSQCFPMTWSLFIIYKLTYNLVYQDPFYDGDTYRGAGGDGTSNWIYTCVSDLTLI